jgi:hypothetical protein
MLKNLIIFIIAIVSVIIADAIYSNRNKTYNLGKNTYESLSDKYKGICVFDFDDTLKTLDSNGENRQWANCRWAPNCAGSFDNDQCSVKVRSALAIQSCLSEGYDIAIYTAENRSEIMSGGKLEYLESLGIPRLNVIINNFKKEIPNYQYNFLTSDAPVIGTSKKNEGLKSIANHFGYTYQQIVMFDDSSKNVKMINDEGMCAILVSNTETSSGGICGISRRNLEDGLSYLKGMKPCPIVSGQESCNPHSRINFLSTEEAVCNCFTKS